MDYARILSVNLKISSPTIETVLSLTEQGNSPSFIARHKRVEVGYIDEFSILKILKLYRELKSFEEKKNHLLKSLEEKNLIATKLGSLAQHARSKTELGDISAVLQPYKSGKTLMAVNRGLKVLCDLLLKQEPLQKPLEALANDFIVPDGGFSSAEEVLEGVRSIMAEEIAREPRFRGELRQFFIRTAFIKVLSTPKTNEAKAHCQEYVGRTETFAAYAGHTYFAVHKGERYKYLATEVVVNDAEALNLLSKRVVITKDEALKFQIEAVIAEAYQRYIKPTLVAEIKQRLRDKSQDIVLDHLVTQFYHQLMQAPFGKKPLCAIVASSENHGVIVAVGIDGKLLDTTGFMLTPEMRTEAEAFFKLWREKHGAQAFVIWQNEFSQAIYAALKEIFNADTQNILIARIAAPEAKIFAASEPATQEFAAFDENMRIAMFAAQKFMDPLAALTLIDPLKLNLGAYQSEIDQQLLASRLATVKEIAVNRVTPSDDSLPGAWTDPRPGYETIVHDPNIKSADNVKPGIVLKGRVVTLMDYGVFVDIGIEHNALLHRSQMPENLLRNPARALRMGQVISVKVIGVEREHGHIRLAWYEAPKTRQPKPENQSSKLVNSDRSDKSDMPDRSERRRTGPPEQRRFSDRPRPENRRGSGPHPHDRRDRGPQQRKHEFGTLGDQFKALFGK